MPNFDTGVFSRDWAEARARFLDAARGAGAALREWPHPLQGPAGEALAVDTAWLGPRDAARVLVLVSGTHGVEGFCGSGIQTFVLRDGVAARVPEGVALVLLHAVNPFGFAWLRRVDEENVDLNRNFLDHAAPHPVNADYDGLTDALNPSVLDEGTLAASLAAVQRFQQERGATAAYRALSGGQYAHPRGVQYGGTAPVWANRTLRSIWAEHAAGAEVMAFLDLHSGLGPRGVGLLLQTAAEASVAARLARAWWPDVIRSEPAAGSDAALVSGLVGPAFVAAHPEAAAVGVVVEFGTRDMLEVMTAVLVENWLHHHGDRTSETGRAIERRMRDAFYVDEDDWKEKICMRAKEVLDRALAGIAAFDPESVR